MSMTTEEVLADLAERMENGIAGLDEMAADALRRWSEADPGSDERVECLTEEYRLKAKASGMAVARDYLRSY